MSLLDVPVSTLWGIVDIDGTISDCSARAHLATMARAERDPARRAILWDEFHARCADDPPHAAEIHLIQAWLLAGGRIVYLTGRNAKFRDETQSWLLRHELPTTPLIMRDEGNYRGSKEYKLHKFEFINSRLLPPGDQVIWVMEDQIKLVDQWRDLGVTCFQPRHSAFGDDR